MGWERKAERHVWAGDFDLAAADAEEMRRNLIAALATVALLVVVVAFYTVYTRRIRRKNRKLYEQIMQLQTVKETKHENVPQSDANSLFASICALLSSERLYTNADLNRGDLAQRLGTNDRYIADAISEGSGGQTFLQFVNGYHLARATKLLTETDEPIEQIAFDSGFNNRRTFNRVFRDEYEMSPSDFRRAAKEH